MAASGSWIFLAVALVLNATANLLIKFGVVKATADGPIMQDGLVAGGLRILSSPLIVGGVLCFGLNLAAYMLALQKLAISIAYPIMVSVGFAIIVVIAGWRLQERLSTIQWVGVALILLGVYLVASRAGTQLNP
jgi:multidrug transporter EmrE-like cation transporter